MMILLILWKVIKKKYSNLFYCRFSADNHSNEKVYRIFQMAGEEIDCDYLWVRSDVLLCDKFFLYSLMYYFEKEYDFIFTITQGKEYKQIIETHDKQLSLELWLEKWPAALNSLPDEYNNKLEAIQAFGKYGGFLNHITY